MAAALSDLGAKIGLWSAARLYGDFYSILLALKMTIPMSLVIGFLSIAKERLREDE